MIDRIPLDDLNSDQLDELYADLERYEQVQGEMNERAIDLTRDLARAEAEATRWKDAWQLAHDRSAKHRERAEEAEAGLRITEANLRGARFDSLTTQHSYHHALTSVYAMQRVRAVASKWGVINTTRSTFPEMQEAIGAPDTCRGRGKCTWMEPNSTDRERADRAEKRLALARAEAQEWHTHFLDGGDVPATHALAMVLLLLDQTPPTD